MQAGKSGPILEAPWELLRTLTRDSKAPERFLGAVYFGRH